MALLLTLIPLSISFLTGYLLVRLMFAKEQKVDLLFLSFLAFGLGLGVSAFLTFFSFLLFNEFSRVFVIAANVLVLCGLIYRTCQREIPLAPAGTVTPVLVFALGWLVFSFILYNYARFYPYGGWDAWQVWNFKARFLFLGGEHWQNMFDPVLWRNSPHYPLLLPLINVWAWSFLPAPIELGPLVISILLTLLTAGLLACGLRKFIPWKIAFVAPLLFLTLPFYVKMAISQYSDITLSYYVLAALLCLVESRKNSSRPFAALAGIFLGFLSFTKPEGMIAALMIAVLAFPHFLFKDKSHTSIRAIKVFYLCAAVAFLPTVLFQGIYSPGNQTFINGLISSDHPSNLYRLKFILAYAYEEVRSGKWHMLWGFLFLGIVLGWRRAWGREIALIPLFLLTYATIIGIYYFINTYFKIEWWMQVTLNRILFSLLPVLVFWAFYSLWQKSAKDN